MSKDRTTSKVKKAMRLQLFSRMMEYEKSIEEQDYISNLHDHFLKKSPTLQQPESSSSHDPLAVADVTNATPLDSNVLLSPLDSPVDKD